MKDKDFKISLEHTKKLLNKFDLLGNADFYKKEISEEFIQITRKNDFFESYLFAIQNFDYNFSLSDESLMQLQYNKESKGNVTLRYAYYQFPYDFPTYKEYLINKGFSFRDVGYNYKYVYEQALIEAPRKENFVLIRYDYSEKEYSPGVHSVSHFHIGSRNTIRIPSSVVVTPLLFALFIIKQVYHDQWKSMIKDSRFNRIFRKTKYNCYGINSCFFADIDKKELYLK